MLEPVGPLPASVYWRRRAVALGLVLIVLLLLWALWPGGGDGDRRNAAAVTPTASTASVAPGELTATPPADDPGRAPDPGSGPADGSAGSTSPAPRPTPTKTTTTTPPAAPEPCGDKALRVTVAPARAAYPVGAKPVITLMVRNVSKISCSRDLGAAQQEILLYRGTERLWSSNDCYPEGERAVRTLRPSQEVTSSVEWSGKLSRPRCAGVRTVVGAGNYALVGRLGTARSARAPIALR